MSSPTPSSPGSHPDTEMYLAPPVPPGLASLQGAAGATRAPQGAAWGSEGAAGCGGLWTCRRAGSPPHPAGEKDRDGQRGWGGGLRVQPRGQGALSGTGEEGQAATHTRKKAWSCGLLLSAGMCTVKRSKSSAPFRRSSITEASNRPAAPRRRNGERSSGPQGSLSFFCLGGSQQPMALPPILLAPGGATFWGSPKGAGTKLPRPLCTRCLSSTYYGARFSR